MASVYPFLLYSLWWLFALIPLSFCRIHNIELKADKRGYVRISTFGILRDGNISITIRNLTFSEKSKPDKNFKVGFSIQKTESAGMSKYMKDHTDHCLLEGNTSESSIAIDLFVFNWNKDTKVSFVEVMKCGNINPTVDKLQRKSNVRQSSTKTCLMIGTLPLGFHKESENHISLNGSIVISVHNETGKGLYTTLFHNCHGSSHAIDMTMTVVEKNDGCYLSAGEAPLPMVHGFFAVVFSVLACIWFYILRQSWSETFKVHYLMFLLVMLKALDVLLNAVNLYYIGRDGTKAESWAVLHYIAHLFKGGLLFTTIILLGTGYFFIKHVLSGRDKKIFLVVIPLQIFDNIALIIMESTEEAQADYVTWGQIFILVDLLCCGAVLFPVIWAIRHLKEASQTDGKAAVNLAKLKLFRQFYIIIVCYIYFTRIIVAIVKVTVPFQYMWLDEFFMNLATMGLFIMTGYKFRPGSDNPYLHVPQEDEDLEMEEIVTQSGLTENVTRVQNKSDNNTVSRVKLSQA